MVGPTNSDQPRPNTLGWAISELLPTPTASKWGNYFNPIKMDRTKPNKLGLAIAADMLPTPTASRFSLHRMQEQHTRMYPTPTAQLGNPKHGMWLLNSNGDDTCSKFRAAFQQDGLLPTPTVCGNNNRKGSSATSGDGLATVLKRDAGFLPTPSASQERKNLTLPASQIERDNLAGHFLREGHRPGLYINPAFVEGMMGFPGGWTDVNCENEDLKPICNWDAGIAEPKVLTQQVPNAAARLKALGNAVVPALALQFFRVIDHLHQSYMALKAAQCHEAQ